MKSLAIIFLSVAFGAGIGARAQTAGTAPQRAQVAGTIESVNAAAKSISIKSDKGETVTLVTTDRSFLRHLPAGETDTKKAVSMALGDIAAGDRVVATYQTGSDQKTLEARTVLVMTKSDVAEVHQKEMEDWQKRGTVGNLVSADPGAKTFTLKTAGRTVTVQASAQTEMLRYALDSAKIADAKPGTFADLKPGDEVHVLGNKSEDGGTVTAEKIVFGSFKQIAATVVSADPATGELKVKNLAVKKGAPVILKITPDTTIKKLPEQMAAMLARRYGAGRGQGQGQGGGQGGGRGQWAGAGRGNGAPGGGGFGGGMRGGRGMDIKQVLDNLPATHITDLKPGDAIMVSTTEGTDSTHMTAIMLLAGVEPILTAAPDSTRDIMSGWNLGGGGGGEGQ